MAIFAPPNAERTPLIELAQLFLKLGTIAFGGPAAHIAMMEDEVVRRRRWLTREQFLDYLGATNLIPGPNSTEMAIHIGHGRRGWPGLLVAGVCFIPPAALTGMGATAASVGLWPLFGVFAKVGSVLFGSGYVLLALLRADLVQRFHWLTERQLLDAVAVGQVTPGPVFTTATFIGYLLAGWTGAAVATLAIFLPAFLLVAASGPFVPRLRRSRLVAMLLDGVTVGALALMAVVTWQLGRVAVVDLGTAALLVASAILLRFRLNSTWLIVAGAGLGMILSIVRAH